MKVTFYKNTGLLKTQFVTLRYISHSSYISSLLMHESYVKKKVKEVKKKNTLSPKCVWRFHESETLLMVIWFHIRKTIKLTLFLILINLPVLVV